jgi:DNA-binding NarL/FixJ family response regulator
METGPPGIDPGLRVVVADDHPLFLGGVRALVAAAPDLQVVGTASTGDEQVAVVSRADPDVVVTDLRMPGLPVIEAIQRLRAEHAQRNILVFTMHDDDALVEGALQA